MRILLQYRLWAMIGVLVIAGSAAHAQVTTANVLTRVVAAVATIEKAKSQILFIQIDNLKNGSTDSQTYSLSAGSAYSVIAIGDEQRIQDLDLEVYDENNSKVGEDSDAQNVAKVTVRPRWSGTFTFAVSAYRMSHQDGFYGIIVYRED
ncbi:MAG: hypothetical protein AAB354_11325 [candidate division KSB1 bacterium]